MGFSLRVKITFAFFIFLCSFVWAIAQSQEHTFDHLTIEEGLSQSTVYAITQDAQGFMWFGTRDGLNRYDSRKVKVYYADAAKSGSISDNTIYTLLSDSDGKLWIGTSSGVNVFDSRTDRFNHTVHEENNEHTLSNNTVDVIQEDSHKNIWVGTRHGLNLLLSKDSLSFLRFVHSDEDSNSLVNDDVRSILQDHEGAVWIGTSGGLSKLIYKDSAHYTFTSYYVPVNHPTQLKGNWINSIVLGDEGRLILGTEKTGLMIFDPKTEKFQALNWIRESDANTEAIRTILRDKNGDYWIGTMAGLYISNPQTGKLVRLKNIPEDHTSLRDNSVRSLYTDRDGSVWIGTFHGGIDIHSPLSKQFQEVTQHDDLHFKVAS